MCAHALYEARGQRQNVNLGTSSSGLSTSLASWSMLVCSAWEATVCASICKTAGLASACVQAALMQPDLCTHFRPARLMHMLVHCLPDAHRVLLTSGVRQLTKALLCSCMGHQLT